MPGVPLALPLEQDLQGALPLRPFPLQDTLRLRPLPLQRCGGTERLCTEAGTLCHPLQASLNLRNRLHGNGWRGRSID